MTDAEKLKMVKAMTGETDEDTLSTYLSIAGNKVCRKAYALFITDLLTSGAYWPSYADTASDGP